MLSYTSWYQLFVYSYNSCILSTYMLFSVIIQFSCLSCYLVILYLQLFLLLFCAHCLYVRALPFIHTLTRSLSDDPGFVRPDFGCFVSFGQVFVEAVCFAKSWSFSLFDSGILIFLAFILFPDSLYIRFSCYSSLYLYDIMRECLYVIL